MLNVTAIIEIEITLIFEAGPVESSRAAAFDHMDKDYIWTMTP